MFATALARAAHAPLDAAEAEAAFDAVFAGAVADDALAAFLLALAARGESAGELTGLMRALRRHALPFPAVPDAIDVCGTGGDGGNTPNVSTAVALVLAGCGVPVVKHGNRAVSSRCGSADVLEALGVRIDAAPDISARALRDAHICFLFAPLYHPAVRRVADLRRRLGRRTIFNLAGPLANPAQPGRQLLGVYDRTCLRPMAEALRALGTRRAWLVHGRDGLDEISTQMPSDGLALDDDRLEDFTIDPAALGVPCPDPAALQGGDAAFNAALILHLLDGEGGAFHDIVALNAAAALIVGGRCADLPAGLVTARQALATGAARTALARLIAVTNS